MGSMILSPSILSADFKNLADDIKKVENAGAKYIHVDVMDGMFVPSISFGMPVMKSIRSCTDLVFDTHLMIEDPDRYLEYFKDSGADIITVHLETLKHPKSTIKKIKDLGCKVGLAINPETPVESLNPYLRQIDMALIMTVHPGFGGQSYIHDCTDKIKKLTEELKKRKLDIDIEVDGGLCKETLPEALEAGANVIVAGSAVFKGEVKKNAKELIDMMEDYKINYVRNKMKLSK